MPMVGRWLTSDNVGCSVSAYIRFTGSVPLLTGVGTKDATQLFTCDIKEELEIDHASPELSTDLYRRNSNHWMLESDWRWVPMRWRPWAYV